MQSSLFLLEGSSYFEKACKLGREPQLFGTEHFEANHATSVTYRARTLSMLLEIWKLEIKKLWVCLKDLDGVWDANLQSYDGKRRHYHGAKAAPHCSTLVILADILNSYYILIGLKPFCRMIWFLF